MPFPFSVIRSLLLWKRSHLLRTDFCSPAISTTLFSQAQFRLFNLTKFCSAFLAHFSFRFLFQNWSPDAKQSSVSSLASHKNNSSAQINILHMVMLLHDTHAR